MNHKKSIYLSGSIEFSKDPVSWRNHVQKCLCKYYNVINPKSAFCPFTKEEEGYKEWIKTNFVLPDMHLVMTCDYFFVKLDKGVARGSGTYGELTMAGYLNKHIVYFLDGIKESEIPGWSLGCLAGATKIASIDEGIELYKSLKKENK